MILINFCTATKLLSFWSLAYLEIPCVKFQIYLTQLLGEIHYFVLCIQMEKNEFDMLIKHYILWDKTAVETKSKLDKYYGESAPSFRNIYKWFADFRCERRNINDAEHFSSSSELATQVNVNKWAREISEAWQLNAASLLN